MDPEETPEDTDYAAMLLEELETGRMKIGYPTELDLWIAMRESDDEAIRRIIGWNKDRNYFVDNLPEKISIAFADFLWGEEATIEPAGEKKDNPSKDLLDSIIDENMLSDELHHAEQIKSSEGEVWWRIYRDDAQSPHPIIDWHSRTEVVPMYRGRRLLAVAFVDVIEETHADGEHQNYECWRRLEVYGPDVVINALYRSSTHTELGTRMELTDHVDTMGMLEEWRHGRGMLAGRIVNRRGKDHTLGRSDYHGIKHFLLELNKTHTVDAENFALAGKKRAVMPRKYAKKDGTMDEGEEIFYTETADEMEEDNTFRILQYEYNPNAAQTKLDQLEGRALTRVGLSRQFVDPNATEGLAASGTALRVRLMPTALAARGKARAWDASLPEILMKAQQVDALPENLNGFGRQWSDPNEPPSIERGSILPEDEQEKLDYHIAAVGADLESIQTAIEELHPDWDDDRVKEEVKRILRENAAAAGFTDPFAEDNTDDDAIDEPPPPDDPDQVAAEDIEEEFDGSGEEG